MHATWRWKSPAASRQAPVWIGMAAVAAVSWFYLTRMDQNMAAMARDGAGNGSMAMGGGDLSGLLATTTMWVVMMVAMMLPAIVPSAVLFSNLAARRHAQGGNRRTAMYVAGYAACWILFAVPAATLQWSLMNTALLDSMAKSTSALLSGALLVTAGLYQFTPLKTACLSKCRTPLGFFIAKWRDGTGGALVLGIQQGSYCVGCCWGFMAVMFVVGAMNLAWMGALTVLVLSEKLVPPAWRLDQITGGVLVASGLLIGLRFVG